jgi:3-oxoacyl-[acyl-carrier-protein] synthase II
MNQFHRRVAITGIGLVTPLGNDAPATWLALLAGRSGVAPIASFDASGFPVRIAAEVKALDVARADVEPKLLKLANRDHRFALVAAREALRDAGIAPGAPAAERWGCVVGAGMMGVRFDQLTAFHQRFAAAGVLSAGRLAEHGPAAADPVAFARSQVNTGLALLVRAFGIRGYASSVHTACASGGQAVGQAVKLIRRGAADAVLAGGFDSMINPVGLASFCLLGALSTDNERPERASRPFDRTRNGFVLGEGAGFLVLEELEAARRRRARIYAELAGEASSLSSYRITDSHPSGDGPIQALRWALRDASVLPHEVDYVNAHGTSTPMNDRSECAAIHAVFERRADRIPVSSTKSLMGHPVAAAGAVEAAICALVIRAGAIPVNANLRQRDPDCDLDFVIDQPRRRAVQVALSNSFGFGGTNHCLVLRSAEVAM